MYIGTKGRCNVEALGDLRRGTTLITRHRARRVGERPGAGCLPPFVLADAYRKEYGYANNAISNTIATGAPTQCLGMSNYKIIRSTK